MNKKILVILIICLFCFMAIGSGSTKVSQEPTNTTSEQETTSQTSNLVPSIDEQVLFEYDGIKLTAKEISDDWLGPQLKVLIENDSDKDVTVSLDAIAVNDYMVSAWLYEDVSTGKKSNATFDIWSSTLTDAGISNIGKIDLYFSIINQANYSTIYESDEIEIKTSLYDQMDNDVNNVGSVIVNENGIQILGKGLSDDSIWGNGVVLYIENNTDRNILVTSDSLSVNGYMITGYLYSTVKSGKKAVETIILSSSDLEDNDIDKINEISISLEVSDDDTWRTIFTTDEISLNFE